MIVISLKNRLIYHILTKKVYLYSKVEKLLVSKHYVEDEAKLFKLSK